MASLHIAALIKAHKSILDGCVRFLYEDARIGDFQELDQVFEIYWQLSLSKELLIINHGNFSA